MDRRHGRSQWFELKKIDKIIVATCNCGAVINNATLDVLENHLTSGEHPNTSDAFTNARIYPSVICKCGVTITGNQSHLSRHIEGKYHKNYVLKQTDIADRVENAVEEAKEEDVQVNNVEPLENEGVLNVSEGRDDLNQNFAELCEAVLSDNDDDDDENSYDECQNEDQESYHEHGYSKGVSSREASMMNDLMEDFNIVDGLKAQCKTCYRKVKSKALNMRSHLRSEYHKNKAEELKSFNVEEATAEIQYAALGVLCNNPCLKTATMMNGLHRIFNDSEKMQSIKYKDDPDQGQKRNRDIICDVIAPAQKERLVPILKSQEFCLMIDETTDVSNQQAMCCNVRFVDYSKIKISESLFDILPCYETDENEKLDAENLFGKVAKCFEESGIPVDNLIFFSADNTNVMMGCNNSVATRISQSNPNTEIVGCAAHIENLVAKKSIKVFPLQIQNLASETHEYMKHGARKERAYHCLEEELGLGHLNISAQSWERWITYYDTCLTILRQWGVLKRFFRSEVKYYIDNARKVQNPPTKFVEYFEDEVNHATFMFLESAMSNMMQVNMVLQSRRAIVIGPHLILAQLFKDCLIKYMKKDYVDNTSIELLDPHNEGQYKDLSEIDIGVTTETFLQRATFNVEGAPATETEKQEIIRKFREKCQEFYMTVCDSLKKKCNDFMDYQDSTHIFNPENVFKEPR